MGAMRGSIIAILAVMGLALGACKPKQIVQTDGLRAAIDSTPLGHLGQGCRYAGAAAFDAMARDGAVVDSAGVRAHEGTLVLVVRDLRSHAALSGAEASILVRPGERISVRDSSRSASGSLRLSGIRAGLHPLRVRRIGYVMMEGFALLRAGMTDTLVVSLNGDRNVFGDIGC